MGCDHFLRVGGIISGGELEDFPSCRDGEDAHYKNTTDFPWQRDVPNRKN